MTTLLTSWCLTWIPISSTSSTHPEGAESKVTAIQLDPVASNSAASNSSWLVYGDLQFESGDFREAIQSYQRAKKESVSQADLNSIEYRLALTYEALAQFEDAKSSYGQLSESTNDAFLTLAATQGLCRILEKTGFRQQARERRCDLLLSGMKGFDFDGANEYAEQVRGDINHLLAASLGMELFQEPLSYFSSNSLVSSGLGFEPQRYLRELQTRSGRQRKSRLKFAAFQSTAESTEQNDEAEGKQQGKAKQGHFIRQSDADSLVILKQSSSFLELVVSVSMSDTCLWDFFDQLADQASLELVASPTCQQKLKSTKIPLRMKSVTGEYVLRWSGCRCGLFWKQEQKQLFIGLCEELSPTQRREVLESQTHFYATIALLQHPENYYGANSQALLGHLLFARANWEGAVAHYQKALLTARELPGQARFVSGIHFNMAKALMRGSRASESRKHYFQVIDGAYQQDLRALSWLYLARMEIGQSKFSSAKRYLSKVGSMTVATHLKQIANVMYQSSQILSGDLGPRRDPPLRAARQSRPEILLFANVVEHLMRQERQRSETVDVQLLNAVVSLQKFIDSEAKASQLLEAYPSLPLILAKAYQKLGLPDLALKHLCDARASMGRPQMGSEVNDEPLVEMQENLLLDLLDSGTAFRQEGVCDFSLFGFHSENLSRWLGARSALVDGRYEKCISLGSAVLKEPECHWRLQERIRSLLAEAYEKTGDLLSASFYNLPQSTGTFEEIEKGTSGSCGSENRK